METLHSAASVDGIIGVEGHGDVEWCNPTDVGEEIKIVGDVDVSTTVDECMIVWVLRDDVDYVVVVDATDA
jgi:hypothetical protein